MKYLLFLVLLPTISFCQNTKPSIVVLGVTHSAQLISFGQQPAVLRAFVNRLKPGAILIERSLDEFSRSDFYEFTFEQQYVLVPLARENNIPLFPIDWLPKDEDLLLAFGTKDLEVPAFTRNESGFWGFTNFTDSSILTRNLYYAEDSSFRLKNAGWYIKYPEKNVNLDFARRLFLYRTFMQTKRIEAAAKNYSQNDTLLVVIGDLHKDDIERNLVSSGYKIISPANFGKVTNDEIRTNFKLLDAFAIATFNLLSVQSRTNVVDSALLAEAIGRIKAVNSSEASFFEIKYLLFTKKITSIEAINRYQAILERIEKDTKFTWTGVKNTSRLDSYIDPFGNMTLWQRIHVELAREYYKIGNTGNYNKEKELLMNELQGQKRAMLLGYWQEYVEK